MIELEYVRAHGAASRRNIGRAARATLPRCTDVGHTMLLDRAKTVYAAGEKPGAPAINGGTIKVIVPFTFGRKD